MRKKILFGIALVFLIGLSILAFRLPPILLAANGYAAKWACSNIYLGGRSLEQAVGDLPSNPLAEWLDVDASGNAQARATLFGRFARSAVHRDGYGCTLLPPGSGLDELTPLPTRRPISSVPKWPEAPPFVDMPAVDAALERAFIENEPSRPKNTRAAVVIYDGALIAERYGHGFSATTRLPGWSMTKSVLNALYGRAALLGHLVIDDSPAMPGWQDERRTITYDHLLRMSSGLSFSEDYADLTSDAVHMLFLSRDTGLFAAQKELGAQPDELWYYSSGTSNLLSRALRDILGGEDYARFADEELFTPLGMRSAVIEPDSSGTFVASSFGWATAQDWARFGLLYLDDGMVAGRRLLPAGWVDYSARPTPSAPKGIYGAHFWLNAGPPGKPEDRRWPDLPDDLYLASGFNGQAVVVVPSHHAVIVRLGLSQGNSAWRIEDFLRDVLDALPTAQQREAALASSGEPSPSAFSASGVE